MNELELDLIPEKIQLLTPNSRGEISNLHLASKKGDFFQNSWICLLELVGGIHIYDFSFFSIPSDHKLLFLLDNARRVGFVTRFLVPPLIINLRLS